MPNTVFLPEDAWIEKRRMKSVEILLQRIEQEQSMRVRNALDCVAQKL